MEVSAVNIEENNGQELRELRAAMTDENTKKTCLLEYVPREIFDKQFEGELPVSYDELTAQNSYLILIRGAEENTKAERFSELQSLQTTIQSRHVISDEAYEKNDRCSKEGGQRVHKKRSGNW